MEEEERRKQIILDTRKEWEAKKEEKGGVGDAGEEKPKDNVDNRTRRRY